MDEDIKAILTDLAQAISSGLEGSSRVNANVKRLEDLGYKLALYLEATILLSKEGPPAKRGGHKRTARVRSGSLTLNQKDVKFLKSLKIALHDEPRRR